MNRVADALRDLLEDIDYGLKPEYTGILYIQPSLHVEIVERARAVLRELSRCEYCGDCGLMPDLTTPCDQCSADRTSGKHGD